MQKLQDNPVYQSTRMGYDQDVNLIGVIDFAKVIDEPITVELKLIYFDVCYIMQTSTLLSGVENTSPY